LASITKIAAAVPLVMRLYSSGQMDIHNPLSAYLPALDTTNKAALRVDNILYHQAGLKPWIPFYRNTLENLFPNQDMASREINDDFPYKLSEGYYLNKHLTYRDNYFNHAQTSEFPIEIANAFYGTAGLRDTIFQQIYQSELRENNNYKYSDLGFYLLYQTIEEITGQQFDKLLYDSVYKPLGLQRMGFNPLHWYNKKNIVPTENDIVFRKQLLHGYVHDPGAAMLGGVSGHAGLFSNAAELGKLMQMYLNKGSYGGMEFIPKDVFNKFIVCENCEENRRGLGFDKPEPDKEKPTPVSRMVSPQSFGHSGFTGTLAWADPEQEIVYVFLSNRVHPDALNTRLIDLNVRTNIQNIIYESIQFYTPY